MKDVLGKALLDYWEGSEEVELTVHCSHAENETMNASYFFREWDQMPELEKSAIHLVKGVTLDIGSGVGSHALLIQEKGNDIDALELSDGACEVMRKRGVNNVINEDVFNLNDKKYDTILLLMNGIGIAGTVGRLELLLRKLKNNLSADGQIILDSSDIVYLFQNEDGSMWIDLNAHYYGELQYRFEYKGEFSEEFDWLFIDQEKLIAIADLVCFECQIIKEGEHYDYLARLILKKG